MKILFSTHSPTAATGYGRVAKYLGEAIHRAGHELIVAGLGYDGKPHNLPFGIVGVDPTEADNGQQSVANLIKSFKPKLTFTMGDPWMHDRFPDLPELMETFWLGYYAVDAQPIPKIWQDWMTCIDHPVVFSEWALIHSQKAGICPDYIPLGVDSITFRPTSKLAAKKSLKVEGKFVVGCVAKNQVRKNLPALIMAFGKFHRDHPDSVLLLHSPPDHPAGYNLAELIELHDLKDAVFSFWSQFPEGCPDANLSLLYNAMDVHVITSTAEGFCLPVIEAGACGVPSLVTDYSAVRELVTDPFQRLGSKAIVVGVRNFQQVMIDVDELAEKLSRLYKEPNLLASLGQLQRCHSLNYRSENTCSRFVHLLDQLEPTIPVKTGKRSARFFKV